MNRKYLKGSLDTPKGIGIDSETISDASLIFNEDASSFSETPLLGVVDLYDNGTLVFSKYGFAYVENYSENIETDLLTLIKVNNNLSGMVITS